MALRMFLVLSIFTPGLLFAEDKDDVRSVEDARGPEILAGDRSPYVAVSASAMPIISLGRPSMSSVNISSGILTDSGYGMECELSRISDGYRSDYTETHDLSFLTARFMKHIFAEHYLQIGFGLRDENYKLRERSGARQTVYGRHAVTAGVSGGISFRTMERSPLIIGFEWADHFRPLFTIMESTSGSRAAVKDPPRFEEVASSDFRESKAPTTRMLSISLGVAF